MDRFFTFINLSFRVQSESVSDLDWLAEFMRPHFKVSQDEAGPADVEITLHQESGKFANLLARGPVATGSTAEAFTLDNKIIVLPEWQGEEGWLTLYEEKFQTFFMVSADRRQVHLLAAEPSRGRIPLMRVLREYAMNHYMQQGGVYFHASAVVFGDKGLLIVGTKNAGKTSLMTHFLRHAGATYVANDRVLVEPESVPLDMHGMPTIATIRSAMPPLFPGLQSQLKESKFNHHLTLQESADRNRQLKPWRDGRYGLTPAQLLSLHGAVAKSHARPYAVLFPRVMREIETMEALPLKPEGAVTRVPDTLFGALTLRNAIRQDCPRISIPGVCSVAPGPMYLNGTAT